MGKDTIDTSNNISPYLRKPQYTGIKNYFLEALERSQATKKKIGPIFSNYIQGNSMATQWNPNTSSQGTASASIQ